MACQQTTFENKALRRIPADEIAKACADHMLFNDSLLNEAVFNAHSYEYE
jgi:hypothetical protein